MKKDPLLLPYYIFLIVLVLIMLVEKGHDASGSPRISSPMTLFLCNS